MTKILFLLTFQKGKVSGYALTRNGKKLFIAKTFACWTPMH